jgi:hypothetical protein
VTPISTERPIDQFQADLTVIKFRKPQGAMEFPTHPAPLWVVLLSEADKHGSFKCAWRLPSVQGAGPAKGVYSVSTISWQPARVSSPPIPGPQNHGLQRLRPRIAPVTRIRVAIHDEGQVLRKRTIDSTGSATSMLSSNKCDPSSAMASHL